MNIIQKIMRDFDESRERRDLTIESNSKNIEESSKEYRENIKYSVEQILQVINNNHSIELNTKLEENILIAYTEVIEKYTEIIWLFNNLRDSNNTELQKKGMHRTLKREIKYFSSFINNHFQRISLYWEVPSEFWEICEDLKSDITTKYEEYNTSKTVI